MPSLFEAAVANRTSATCASRARPGLQIGQRIETQIFWAFERSRRATGSLPTSPALSRIATIGFILAATVSRWSVPGCSASYLPYSFACHKRTAATHEHNRACRSRIARCARSEQLPPLTAQTLTQRRANALELADAMPKPNLPDIAADEIQVESAFGAKPIRVLTYRPVTSNTHCPPSCTSMAAAS